MIESHFYFILKDKALLQRIEFDIPSNEKAVRLKMDHFCFEITPINRNKFKLRSLMNIEPKVAYIPHFVINFFARKVNKIVRIYLI